jgi:small redox-active disulfide protein 2
MLEVKVLGPGCARCKKLFEETQKALAETGLMASLTKVETMPEIMSYGVMMTPALAVDGEIKCAGRVPPVSEIARWLRDAADEV